MPIFEVQGPDGKTYEADAPSAAAAAGAFAPKQDSWDPNSGPVGMPGSTSLQSRLQAPATGVNSAIAHTLGFPVDAGTSVVNLGRTLVGQPRLPLSSQAYGGDWFEKQLNDMGVQTTPDNPSDPIQRYGAAAGTVAPALASGNLGTGMRALAGAFGQQYLADVGAPEWAQTAAGVLGNKTGLSDLTKAGASAALTKLEASAAPRVRDSIANASDVSPGLTVAQSTGGGALAKLGAGAAGPTTAEASAQIVDRLAGGMTKQATALAPLGVSHPEVAAKVQEAIQNKDNELSQRADAVYTSGRAAVAKQPGQVNTFNTVNAVDQMLAEAQNPKVLAPPVVTKRLQGLIDTLRGSPPVDAPPGTGLASTPAVPPGASWGDFYDLRKQINTLYDDVPSETITPAMNQTFARLKAAYYQDLQAAPDSPAKATTVKANQIYSGLQDERANLKNSVVASVLGKDGKTSIANPDQVLDRLIALKPASQGYVRSILEQYSPETLDNLRSYAITKNVQDAARGSAASTVSKTDPTKLAPGRLADTGLFTDEQAAELNKRQSALDTALTALPQKGSPTPEATPQSVGRLVGGGFSPTFLGGTVANFLTGGYLEKALNTPFGRSEILNPGRSKSENVNQAVKAYQAALMAQVAQDRAANASQSKQQQTQATPPQQTGVGAPQ